MAEYERTGGGMLFTILKWLLHENAAEIKERSDARGALIACVDPRSEVGLDEDLEDRILSAAQDAVRASLSDPQSAVFPDQSIYTRGASGYAVCGAVECTNRAGESVHNFFVADVNPGIRGVSCELLDSDPRDPKTQD